MHWHKEEPGDPVSRGDSQLSHGTGASSGEKTLEWFLPVSVPHFSELAWGEEHSSFLRSVSFLPLFFVFWSVRKELQCAVRCLCWLRFVARRFCFALKFQRLLPCWVLPNILDYANRIGRWHVVVASIWKRKNRMLKIWRMPNYFWPLLRSSHRLQTLCGCAETAITHTRIKKTSMTWNYGMRISVFVGIHSLIQIICKACYLWAVLAVSFQGGCHFVRENQTFF